MTFHGVRWKGLKPRVVKAPRNDGVWRKVRLDTRNWPHSLKTRVYDFKQETPERMTFKLHLACEGQVEMEQQVWESGLRLYSGSMRARFQFHAWLECESTIRVDTSGFLPDFVVRLRVTKATVLYHEPVVEHIAGFGGTAAKITGELLHDVVHQVKPSLEEKLLERINPSIVRSASCSRRRLIGTRGEVEAMFAGRLARRSRRPRDSGGLFADPLVAGRWQATSPNLSGLGIVLPPRFA
jgi:hypothetical protein